MKIPVSSQSWQPLTFGGVASFAGASFARLLLVESVVALLVAVSLVGFLGTSWWPQLDQAVAGLPAKAEVRNRRLDWGGSSPVMLAEGPFLAVTVDLDGASRMGRGVDLQLELGRQELRMRSLFGYLSFRYPAGWSVKLDRVEARAWWGAWRDFLLIGVGAAAGVALIVSWALLGAVCSAAVRLLAFYLDREVSRWGAWKLAVAAWLPPAVLMAAAIGLYSLQRLDLIGLIFAWLVHWIVGAIYICLAPLWLPRVKATQPRGGNPFEQTRKPTARK